MNITEAYRATWAFDAPRKCREIHDAGLLAASPDALDLSVFEFDDADTIADGDAFVSEELVPGLVPIGGDSSGDRWCFDTRLRIGGTIPVAHCPHDGGGATYVAPSFAGFLYRVVLENLVLGHLYAGRGGSRADLRSLTLGNLRRLEPWLLARWTRRGRAVTSSDVWPAHSDLDAFLREDRAFARMPTSAFEHFK